MFLHLDVDCCELCVQSPVNRRPLVRQHMFADEAGNFDFSLRVGASRYFILATVTMEDDLAAASAIHKLRYDLAWEGLEHPGPFHATTDAQSVRDRFFVAIEGLQFTIDATVIEKRKSRPTVRKTPEEFYQFAWFSHMRHAAPRNVTDLDDLLVVAASLGSKRRVDSFHLAVKDVLRQVPRTGRTLTACWPASSDPGLQIADYCCWAIQRKWELSDSRSYELVSPRITSEYELFRRGRKFYYE